MRSLILAASLLLLPAAASARCQCVCVNGQMRPVCPPPELIAPICQGLCGMAIEPERLTKPLFGGAQGEDMPETGGSSLNGTAAGSLLPPR